MKNLKSNLLSPQTTLDRSDQRSPTQRSMVVIARSGAYSRLESKERSGLSIHSDLKFEFDSEINRYSAWSETKVCTYDLKSKILEKSLRIV